MLNLLPLACTIHNNVNFSTILSERLEITILRSKTAFQTICSKISTWTLQIYNRKPSDMNGLTILHYCMYRRSKMKQKIRLLIWHWSQFFCKGFLCCANRGDSSINRESYVVVDESMLLCLNLLFTILVVAHSPRSSLFWFLPCLLRASVSIFYLAPTTKKISNDVQPIVAP